MDFAIEQLIQEVERQIGLLASSTTVPLRLSTTGRDITLEQQGNEYRLMLYKIKDDTLACLRLPSCAPLREMALPQNAALWQIPAFCEPSWIMDHEAVRQRAKALHALRSGRQRARTQPGQDVWKDSRMLAWAAAEQSSLIAVQGSYQASHDVESCAVALVDYLEEKDQRVVWILNDHADNLQKGGLANWNGDVLFQQIAIQVLRKVGTMKTLGALALMVERFRTASSKSDWLDIIGSLIDGGDSLYVVIDLGIADATLQAALECAFKDLIENLQSASAGSLKVILFSNRRVSIGTADIPVLQLSSSSLLPNGSLRASRNLPASPYLGPHGKGSSRSAIELLQFSQRTRHEEKCLVAPLSSGTDPSRSVGGVATKVGKRTHGPRDWFYQMRSFEACVDASRKDPDDLCPRVRIAVLDTGLDISHPDIAREYSDGRIKYHDFLKNSERIEDNDGHGTHCTSVVARLAPNAEIYVGRVLLKSQAEGNSPTTLTKAIRYAAHVWKVDIISLSLGFTEDDEDLRDEVMKACAERILIFAAAANNTTNEVTPIRFPARMKEVICVFASDAYGRPSDFNPQPRYDRPNFVFPGEGIEGSWPAALPCEEAYRRKDAVYKKQDGTSCATPIAAAVAAGVLEFAWQEREHKIRRVKLLKHCSGMSDIFLKLMVDEYKVGDNRFLYVKPWKLIARDRRKEEIPIHISHTIDKIDC